MKDAKSWKTADGLCAEGSDMIDKPTFGYADRGRLELDEAELVGLCTDICAAPNAPIIKALFPELKLTADALTTMKMCRIDIIGEY